MFFEIFPPEKFKYLSLESRPCSKEHVLKELLFK